jgi:hypothetical protein
VSIADLVAPQTAAPVLVHQVTPGQAMVDDACRTTQRPG